MRPLLWLSLLLLGPAACHSGGGAPSTPDLESTRAALAADVGDCRTGGVCGDGARCDAHTGACRRLCSADADCPASARCDETAGACECEAGTRACGAAQCVAEGPDSCGAKCVRCAAPEGGTAECRAGGCIARCGPGTRLCGGRCIPTTPGLHRHPAGVRPHGLALADLDRDGRQDVLVTTWGPTPGHSYQSERGPLLWLRNEGGGALSAPRSLAILSHPTRVVAGDLDGDGRLDVAAATKYGLARLYARTDGSYGASERAPQGPGACMQGALELADLNGDGRLDLWGFAGRTEQCYGEGGMLELLGRADGGADRVVRVLAPDYSLPPGATLGTLGDFDADGRMDVAFIQAGRLRLLLRQESGWLVSRANYPASLAPAALVSADVDGDGHRDLLVAEADRQQLAYYRGDGTGTLRAPQRLPVGRAPVALVAAELTGDGHLDVAVLSRDDERITLYRGGPTGLGAPVELGVGRRPSDLAAGDLDGDGQQELLVSEQDDNRIAVLDARCPPGAP